MDKFGWVETNYNCSGICTQESIYYFSDVGVGAPTNNCLNAITGPVLFDMTGKYGTAFIIIWFFILIGWCMHWGVYRFKK